MGGYGSGRRMFSGTKLTTDDLISIDIRNWQRVDQLTPYQFFRCTWSRYGEVTNYLEVIVEDNHVILNHKHLKSDGQWKMESYPVYLDWTSCNFGGKRPWFLCPVPGCKRRVAVLYCDGVFACRKCHQVLYTSQIENEMDRMARRADKIRDRLDWEPGFLNGNGWKPKGMHWKTFDRLFQEHANFVDQSLMRAAIRFRVPVDSFM